MAKFVTVMVVGVWVYLVAIAPATTNMLQCQPGDLFEYVPEHE